MRKNLLPEMQKVKMTDKDGSEFVMKIDLREGNGLTYVFLSDTHQPGASRLAQNAMYYIEKISQRLNLANADTVFYRHIYQEQMGSTFGRFKVDWKNEAGPSYKFEMLTNIDDLHSISGIIETTRPVSLQEQVQKTG